MQIYYNTSLVTYFNTSSGSVTPKYALNNLTTLKSNVQTQLDSYVQAKSRFKQKIASILQGLNILLNYC